MQFTEIVVFGIVWGGVMIYFLTPFNRKTNVEFYEDTNRTFTTVFISSLLGLIVHKKALLAFVMLGVTIFYTWSYYSSLEMYFQVHGGIEKTINPTKQAIFYTLSFFIYTLILCFLIAFKNTLRFLKEASLSKQENTE